MLGPDVVQETTEIVKMIQEKMKASQSRQKIYHDKRRKDIEFQVSDHVFLRVNLVVTPRFPKQRNNANIIRVQHQRSITSTYHNLFK